jgi:CDP-glucose 4,6-dehydratase
MEVFKKIKVLNFYKGKKILVTGATGFKGAWLCLWLHMLGAKVYACGMKKNSQKLFFNLNLHNKLDVIYFDINNYAKFNSVVKKINPEIIFHLAAQPLVFESYLKPLNTFKTNILGSLNLFEISRNNKKIKSLIVITTDKVYKNSGNIKPFRETDELGGDDPYSSSKACTEIIFRTYGKSFYYNKFGFASCRAGNVIGGGDFSQNRLIPDLIKKLSFNKKVLIRNPNFVRPWQHVLEPIYGYLLLARLTYQNPKKYSGEYNFGPNLSSCTQVKKVIQKAIKFWGRGEFYNEKKIKNNFKEQKNLSLNILKSQKKLKWNPIMSLDDSIRITIEWYKSVIANQADPLKTTINQIKEFQKKLL